MQPTVTRGGSRWSRGLLAAIIVTSLGGCGDDKSRPAAAGVSRESVAERASDLIGRTVTISGVTNEGHGRHALEIEGDGTFFDGGAVLVVGRNLPNVGTGARVEVTGVVRRFDLAELQREFGEELPVEPGSYETAIAVTDVNLVDPAGTYDPPS